MVAGVSILKFLFICISSKKVGEFLERWKLPLITIYLLAGVCVSPYLFNFLKPDDIKNIRFIEQLSLSFIAFVAGNELNLQDIKGRFKSIKWTLVFMVLSTFTLGSLGVYLLSDLIPFLQSMTQSERIAVSILAGSILVAISPSSTIAIVKELRANGPFVQTALGVTVLIDTTVIVLFSINSSIAEALISNVNFSPSLLYLLFFELGLTVFLGFVIGKIINSILSLKVFKWFKTFSILLLAYFIAVGPHWARELTHHYFQFELHLEPLLMGMVAGCYVCNYGSRSSEFDKFLHDLGPIIYLMFFTLVGVGLNLSILAKVWQFALSLVLLRALGIFIGSFIGGIAAGEPKNKVLLSWMSYLTQAGISVGLSAEVAVQFPTWGPDFATMMIATIVVNQIIGPSFFKWVIYLMKEANPPAKKTDPNIIHNAIIFGNDAHALTLSRHLLSHMWKVKIVQFNPKDVLDTKNDLEIIQIDELNEKTFSTLNMKGTGTIVTMLDDDSNYTISKIANESYSLNVVVRLMDVSRSEEFKKLNALVVSPSTAIIGLLDHYVRTPSAVSILLGMEEDHDIEDFQVYNPRIVGKTLDDLRLPFDVLIISVGRNSRMLHVHDKIKFRLGDTLTIVGPRERLKSLGPMFSENMNFQFSIYSDMT